MLKTAAHRCTPSTSIVKHGWGSVTAESFGGHTRLTKTAHRAPTRFIPLKSSAADRAGASLIALSSYGGGMLQGDTSTIEFAVKENAKLGVISQGCNRIYKQKFSSQESTPSSMYPTNDVDRVCRSLVEAHVAKNGFLVMAPDPCMAYTSSAFQQDQKVIVREGGSAIIIDWYGAGRVANGEQWDFDRLSSRLSLSLEHSKMPVLVDSIRLDQRFGSHSFGFRLGGGLEMNAFCSVLLHGPAVEPVVGNMEYLTQSFVRDYTRVRYKTTDEEGAEQLWTTNTSTSGRVLMGLSKVNHTLHEKHGPTYVARLAATCNEDIYRVLHSGLLPLAPKFGFEFYRDRIQASSTAMPSPPTSPTKSQYNKEVKPTITSPLNSDIYASMHPKISNSNSWSAYMLADSGLPIGGFAHSAGIEAASQLKLLEDDLESYILACTRSTAQLWTPFVLAAHEIRDIDQWIKLDQVAHACIASNGPACRASLDQGEGLLRVASNWLDNQNLHQVQQHVSECGGGHLGTVFGLVCRLMEVDASEACRVLGYCAARDMVSASVRLNLVGPLASVNILKKAHKAATQGFETAVATFVSSKLENDELIQTVLESAASCSPVADAIHPNQDLLSIRLFRT